MSSSFLLPLFAQGGGRPPGSPWDRPELLYASLGIAAALLAGGVVIYLVDQWRKRGAGPADGGLTELTGFRGMLERGEITEEEYNRLRQKVAAKVKSPTAGTSPTSPVAVDPTAGPAPPPIPGPLPDDYFDDPQPPAPPAQPR
jgi:hypothetical protein